MKRDNWIVTIASTRPAGNPNECFYCHRQLGEQHSEECVIRTKTVVVDFNFRTVLAVPEKWSNDNIEYHYNNRCPDDILREFAERENKIGRCTCDISEVTFIRDATWEDESNYGMTFVDIQES